MSYVSLSRLVSSFASKCAFSSSMHGCIYSYIYIYACINTQQTSKLIDPIRMRNYQILTEPLPVDWLVMSDDVWLIRDHSSALLISIIGSFRLSICLCVVYIYVWEKILVEKCVFRMVLNWIMWMFGHVLYSFFVIRTYLQIYQKMYLVW